MKLFKQAAAIIVAVCFFGGTAVPTLAFVTPQNQVEAIDARVIPTQKEAQSAIFEVGQQLHQARLASVNSPTAESEFLAAQRAFEFGRYDEAVQHARNAQATFVSGPNWLTHDQVRR
ncbi:MAG: hypothetical protein ACREQN_12110 [Candidatus Binataceae bacterium]